MNIQKAVRKAVEMNGYITGTEHFKNKVFIKPTDTKDLCICCVNKDYSRRGWQPCASDLIADDWDAISEEEFLSLSMQNNIF